MKERFGKLLGVLVCSMVLVGTLAVAAFADDDVVPVGSADVAWIGETGYETLEAAVTAAKSGDTIVLGEGKYTLYKKGADTKGKNLTFVGKGADKTEWGIGATMPDPDKFGTEYNGDYSFDGAGTITFKNMTLQSSTANYLGFIRADRTITENCTINGKTFYWGYTSAMFKNTTFNAPKGDYALWTYSSPEMTFDGCTFNTSGKTVNVYTDFGAGKNDITVNFSNCTVNNSAEKNKSVLNINDQYMGNFKYRLNISGTNTINNTAEGVDIFHDSVTCSRWFGFGGKASSNNTGRSVVTVDGHDAFKDGKMVGHEVCDNYTDGYKDNAYERSTSDWEKTDTDKYVRRVKKVCNYCGYSETYDEEGYSVTYTDGVDDKEIFKDQTQIVPAGDGTPKFDGEDPSREGYKFTGWSPAVEETVTKNVTYTATWEKEADPTDPDNGDDDTTPSKTNGKTTGKKVAPNTGDDSNLSLWAALLFISGGAAIGTTVARKKKKYTK